MSEIIKSATDKRSPLELISTLKKCLTKSSKSFKSRNFQVKNSQLII